MDEARDDFLAGARLTLETGRRLFRGHLRRSPHHFAPRIRPADWEVGTVVAGIDRNSTGVHGPTSIVESTYRRAAPALRWILSIVVLGDTGTEQSLRQRKLLNLGTLTAA